MKKIIFNPPLAPKPIGPYNQAVVVANMVYTAGQIAIDPKSNEMTRGNAGDQTRIILNNIKAILEAVGTSLDNVVKATVFLKNMNDFPAMNTVYGEFFHSVNAPCRSTIEAARLPKDALVEIEVVATI